MTDSQSKLRSWASFVDLMKVDGVSARLVQQPEILPAFELPNLGNKVHHVLLPSLKTLVHNHSTVNPACY